ncbi:MAG: recombinase family protein [Anaerovoracaceae bacterium]
MKNRYYGYVRVSTKEQNEDRQILALSDFPISRENLYTDKVSGKDFHRPQYQRMVKKLRKGDILVVKSIDRLGRNYEEILEQWRRLTKEKGVDIVVIDMPLLDTRNKNDLTGTLIADIVLNLLSYVAQTERENIRQRQAEGIAAARKKGVKFGRPPIPVPEAFEKVSKRWENGEISSRNAAMQLGISQNTFLRWSKKNGIKSVCFRAKR